MPEPADDPIKRVVLLMLENRSFDQMLGALSSIHPGLDGVPLTGAPYTNSDPKGVVYPQERTCDLQMRLDPDHDHKPVLSQIAAGNSGFVRSFVQAHPWSSARDRQQIMGYYEFPFLPALHTLADNFLVCDGWFSSMPGPTWPNRFFALTGTSHGQVDMPEGLAHSRLASFFAQTQTTVFDRLNERARPWRVYYYDVASSWVLVNQRQPHNLACYRTMGYFFDDAARGDLPDFTFIEPKYYGWDQNDDHPPHNVMKGEKLVADVYNALRASPLWDSTLLVVVFDEHGGFFDHREPPKAEPPDENTELFAFDRLGVRVPAILVSPWLARGVDHTTFDHTSLLKYLTIKWGLGPLGRRVAVTTSIADAMHFLPEPRTDTPGFIRVRNSDLYAPHPDLEWFDRNAHHAAFATFARHLEQQQAPAADASSGEPGLLRRTLRGFRQAIGRWLVRRGMALAPGATEAADQATRVERAIALASSASAAAPAPAPQK